MNDLRTRRVVSRGIARCVAAVLASLGVSSSASAVELTPEMAQLYTSVSILPPDAARMTVCYGFVCRRRAELDFSTADRQALTKIIRAGSASPAAERAAVQKAVIWFDRRIGPVIGTDKRVALADIRTMDAKSNFDCWDTTRNTTSLLLVLQEWHLFKHHRVGNPRYRGNFLVMQLPHNTAVLAETKSGAEWIVDMWTRKYAEAPDVMPVGEWLKRND